MQTICLVATGAATLKVIRFVELSLVSFGSDTNLMIVCPKPATGNRNKMKSNFFMWVWLSFIIRSKYIIAVDGLQTRRKIVWPKPGFVNANR
jgi:hypothetical protein